MKDLAMRRFILTALAAAVLAPAALLAGQASAQVAPATKFQQLLQQDRMAAVYTARRGGQTVRRPAGGGHRAAYRGTAHRGVAYRGGAYRGNVARAGTYHRSYAGRYYGRPYHRAYYGAHYRPYYGGSYYPYGYGAAAVTGAVVGSAIASQPTTTGSSAYCAQRYKSYNPATGTFTGYDGRQHPCP
jgi:hypothetical protein